MLPHSFPSPFPVAERGFWTTRRPLEVATLLLCCLCPPTSAQLSTAGNALLSQDAGSLAGDPAAGDRLGEALLIADLDADGSGELIVGIPGDRIDDGDGPLACGRVQIASWVDGALEPSVQNLRLDDIASLGESCADGDRFGAALVSGFFDDDAYPDVAIGVPYRTVGGDAVAGAVVVLRGGDSGLTNTGAVLLSQDVLDGEGASEASEKFGQTLAVGNFDDDAWDDLVIGVPEADIDGQLNVGTFHVIPGSATGLDLGAAQTFAWPTIPNGFGQIGISLAAGNFDDDPYDELAFGSVFLAGRVFVFEGSASGLTATGMTSFTQDQISSSPAENGDQFGAALAAGDFDGDGRDDLAIAAPQEDDDTSGISSAGLIHVVHGSASGLQITDAVPNLTFSETELGGSQASFDGFGSPLTAADLDGDGIDDLIVGLPLDDLGGFDEGGVAVVPGKPTSSLQPGSATILRQDTDGLLGSGASGVEAGFALAVGNVDGDGSLDLLFGAPGDSATGPGPNGEGVVHLVFGLPQPFFRDGFESGDTSVWAP